MSLIGSLLAFVLIPMKAKPKEADNLAVMALADEVRRLTVALDYWRDSGNALWDENERLREENRRLRQEEAGRQQLYAYVQQQNALMAQQQGQQMAAYHGLLGPIGQQQNALTAYSQQANAYCNCVPSRAQAFDNENTHRQEG